MKETPILFSTAMVQAILAGRKTMTRRVVKGSDDHYYQSLVNHASSKHTFVLNGNYNPSENDVCEIKCPYGQVGDLLWVRETWHYFDRPDQFLYKANPNDHQHTDKWKPSIHMPKAACRIFLRITNIRVERLQDITEQDAITEGIEKIGYMYLDYYSQSELSKIARKRNAIPLYKQAITSFQSLWASINGVGNWDENPWVWVIEFERVNA